MTLLFTNSEQILSCGENWDDDLFGDTAGGGYGISAEASEVIAVGVCSSLDEFQVAQTFQITSDAGGRQVHENGFQVGTTQAAYVELRTLQGAQQGMLGLVEEIEAFDTMTIDRFGCGQLIERTMAGGEVIEGREEFEIAAVTAEKNLTQINQAIDRLLDRGEFPGGVPIPVFHLAVVLKKGHIVGRRLDTQHSIEFVVHLDRIFTQAMLDTGAFDAGRQATVQFLCQLRAHLLAQEAHHLLDLDRENRLPRNGLVKGFHDRLRTKDQIRRTPVSYTHLR